MQNDKSFEQAGDLSQPDPHRTILGKYYSGLGKYHSGKTAR